MRVLVTGGSGYVGSHAVRELRRRGYDVTIYDNLSTGDARLAEGFRLVVGDIRDTRLLVAQLREVDLVMHFAASAYVGESVKDPRKYFSNNVEAGLRLMDAVLYSKVRKFIFSSSCAVYGTPRQLPIVEDTPKEPINPYGATKLFFERVLEAYDRSHGLRSATLRYFNAAGADPSGEIGELHDPETHIIPLALRAAMRRGPELQVFGSNLKTPDGTCIRDFVHVSDLARAHAQAADYLFSGGDSVALNLGSGVGTSLKQLMSEVEQVTESDVPHVLVHPRVGDPPILVADPSRAAHVLGWRTNFTISDIIKTAYAWELTKDTEVLGAHSLVNMSSDALGDLVPNL